MLLSFRRIRFLGCAIGALLLFFQGRETLGHVAGVVALVNLFSSQLMCAMGACALPAPGDWRLRLWPPDPASRINHLSSAVGWLFLGYALAGWWIP